MALMLGAMTMQGIVPGPQVMTTNPDLFWGLIASMRIGNALLVVLNLPLIGVWVALLISRGDPSVFFTRPITLAFMIGTLLVLAIVIAPAARRKSDWGRR